MMKKQRQKPVSLQVVALILFFFVDAVNGSSSVQQIQHGVIPENSTKYEVENFLYEPETRTNNNYTTSPLAMEEDTTTTTTRQESSMVTLNPMSTKQQQRSTGFVGVFPLQRSRSRSRFAPARRRPIITEDQERRVFTTSMLVSAGVIDAFCYRHFKCFPTMMTGNTVRCMDAVARNDFPSTILYMTLIGNYVLGCSVFQSIKIWQQEEDGEDEGRSQRVPSKKNNIFVNWVKRTPMLIAVARIAFAALILSDILERFLRTLSLPEHLQNWHLAPMALAFGMVNTATTDATGTVTYAMTGHWTKIGLGAAEGLLLKSDRNGTGKSSLQSGAVFMLSLFGANLLLGLFDQYKPYQIIKRLPPLGLTIGAVYLSLMTWYGSKKR